MGTKRNVVHGMDDITRRMTSPHYTTKHDIKKERANFRLLWVCTDCKCFLRLQKETISWHGKGNYTNRVYRVCPNCGFRIYHCWGVYENEAHDTTWDLIPDDNFKPERIYEKLKIKSGLFNTCPYLKEKNDLKLVL
ncbi:MAG: hypothetical protein GY870_12605 [archaeon]|nr:hypothetical protein [archaeon]